MAARAVWSVYHRLGNIELIVGGNMFLTDIDIYLLESVVMTNDFLMIMAECSDD